MTELASRERWRQIEQVLDGALDTPPQQRAAFLDDACADDVDLRVAVERLLHADDAAADFLRETAAELATVILANFSDVADAATPGMRIGPYRIVAEAGRGGMAVVYLAERDDGEFRKRVALKLVRAGSILDDDMLRRFRDERQILASLEHPGIARLLDGGVTDEGLPWFAMEYVQGTPIERHCDDHRLSIQSRLALFCEVCDAVQHAHRNRIVHRDLKPGNILITQPEPTDSGGSQVKLLDFGIAKLLTPESAGEAAERTRPGLRMMTPEYASPEQLRGDPVTPAADVYALGVLLYRLLCGRHPYRLTGRTDQGIEHLVLVSRPQPPSATMRLARGATAGGSDEAGIEAAAASRAATPEQLRGRLRGDLDAIVLKALSKDAQHRYATAGEFAAEVRRHLQGLRVRARVPERRRRARLLGGLAILLILLTVAGGELRSRPRPGGAPVEYADVDPRALELYLRARDYAGRMRKEDAEVAAGLYLRALQIDSSFAPARAALATNYALGVERQWRSEEWADSAISHAGFALELDPSLAEALRALGIAYRSKGWLRRSLEAHEHAYSFDSTESQVNVGLGYATLGRMDEAVRHYRLGIPKVASVHRPVLFHNLSVAYAALGLFAKAEEAHEQAVRLAPDVALIGLTAVRLALLKGDEWQAVALADALIAAHAVPETRVAAARAYLSAGDNGRALEHLELAYAASPTSAPDLLAAVLWKTGERVRARELYRAYEVRARARIAQGDESCRLRDGLAVMHAVRGERSEAYSRLEEGVNLGCANYYMTLTDPLFAELRGEPAFQRILAKQKARIDDMRARVEREGL